MKLKNKKTGEIVRVEFLNNYQTDDGAEIGFRAADTLVVYSYNSLAELNEEWEDYEEPEEVWYIDWKGDIRSADINNGWEGEKQIGNYFETKEEAEKAVEKLKAWKRLKGGGFEFMSCSYGHDKTTDDTGGWIRFRVNHLYDERYGCEVEKDLDLLFGGEE